MHDDFCNMPGALLICSYTLRKGAVDTHCVHAVAAQWQLFALVRTLWDRAGTPWALLVNAIVAMGLSWHHHAIEIVKLFAIFSSIFVQSHGSVRNFKSPRQRHGVAVECKRGFIHSGKSYPIDDIFIRRILISQQTRLQESHVCDGLFVDVYGANIVCITKGSIYWSHKYHDSNATVTKCIDEITPMIS